MKTIVLRTFLCIIPLFYNDFIQTKQITTKTAQTKVVKPNTLQTTKPQPTNNKIFKNIPNPTHSASTSLLQTPAYSQEKGFLELEHKDKKPTNPINLNEWTSTGHYHEDEKKLHIGTLDTKFGTFSFKRSYSTHTESIKQTQGPS